MSDVKVLAPGFFTTFQDLGRVGYRKFGVPAAGAMDQFSARLANAILNNGDSMVVLECTLKGPTLQFNKDTLIVISGADVTPKLNTSSFKMYTPIKVKKGDVLTFGKLQYGVRYYIAVSGGFKVKDILGSKSYYEGIADNLLLRKGDAFFIEDGAYFSPSHASIRLSLSHFTSKEINVSHGPEFEWLIPSQQQKLLQHEFTIGKDNNRMAYQLEELVDNNLPSMLTAPVLPGTVQLTPSGKLIILMRDAQTTGGYPRVLQLTEEGINRLSQKRQSETIRFVLKN